MMLATAGLAWSSSVARSRNVMLLLGRSLILTPEQFGAGSSGSDMTTAFASMNAAAVANGGSAITINLIASKVYTAMNAYWPCGILNLTVNGNGATFECVQINGNDVEALFSGTGLASGGPGQTHPQIPYYFINTANIGDAGVTCSTAAQAANFAVGNRVYISAIETRFVSSFPPDRKAWQFAKVTNVNSSTGVITLDQPIASLFSTNCVTFDGTGEPNFNGNGLPKIYNLDIFKPWGVTQTFNNLTITDSAAAPYFVDTGCLSVTYNNCTINGTITPSIAGSVTFSNCSQQACEFDINVNNLTVTGGTMTQFANGSNIENLAINGLTVSGTGSVSQLAPRNISINNLTLTGGLVVQAATAPAVRSLTMSNCTLDSLSVGYGSGGAPRVTLGSGATYASGTLSIPLSYNLNSTIAAFVNKLNVGDRIWVAQLDGTTNTYRETGNFANITAVYSNGANIANADATFLTTLAGTEILMMGDEPISTSLTNMTIGGVAVPNRAWVTECANTLDTGVLTIVSGTGYTTTDFLVRGVVSSVTINVIRPYTGPTSGNYDLQVYNVFPSYQALFDKTVNLRTTGVRTSTFTSNSGWSGANGESAGANLPSAYSNFVSAIELAIPPNFAGSGSQLPQVEITLTFQNM
jgi:hypothetical protein